MPAAKNAPADSLEVRARLMDALRLDLIGPWAGHAFDAEQLPSRERPSNWYVAGFLIPTGTPPDRSADVDEDDDLDTIPESAVWPRSPTTSGRPLARHFSVVALIRLCGAPHNRVKPT